MSWRDRHVLITNLPHDSALWRKANPHWEYRLQARQMDDLYDLYAVGAGVTPKGSDKPIRAIRPGDQAKAETDQGKRAARVKAMQARAKQRGGGSGG